ncbi:MAG: oligosaccharide flippase family protein [Acidobacteria bacterium]|nr:oligosaccharide flippase family protein [Acidobacteriota bacterium]
MAKPGLARNFLWLTVGETAAKVFSFLAFTHLGRTLGPERYGDLEFSIATVVFFTLFVQMGLGSYGAREIARTPERAQDLLGEIFQLRLAMAALSVAVLLGFAAVIPKATDVRELLAAYGLSLLVTPLLLLWFFQGHDAMHWVAGANLLRISAFATAAFLLFQKSSPLWAVGLYETGAVLLSAGFGFWAAGARMGYRLPRLRWKPAALWLHMRKGAPIGGSNLAWAALWFFPVVILGLLRTDESVGWFGAAHRATMSVHTFVWWYFFNLLPAISRTTAQPREELRRLIAPSLELTSWGGPALALALSLPATQLLSVAYGAQFAGAGPLLAALIWAIPVTLLSGHYRFILIAFDLQDRLLWWTLLSAALASVLTIALAPRFGALGAAWGLVSGNLLCFALCCWTVYEAVEPIGFVGAVWGPALATLTALLASAPWRGQPWLRTAGALAVYCTIFVIVERRRIPQWSRRLLGGAAVAVP